MSLRDQLSDENPDALLFDGLDAALVGVGRRCGQPTLAVYDRAKCIGILIARDGMSYEEAEEFFEFNIQGAWVGANTPIVLDTTLYDEQVAPEPEAS